MYLKKYRDKVNLLIDKYLETNINDYDIRNMIKYSLEGGKRLRPIICFYLLEKFNIENKSIIIAIEFLHCSSLILDDLPCMDNDNYRRNKLTFHKKYSEKKAYIVSNFLFMEFNKILVNLKNKEINSYVLDCLLLIVKGQYYDLGYEKERIINKNDIIYNNNLKTYPFFVIAFIIPFFLKNTFTSKDKKKVESLALYFSTAFQICDDFIDYEEDLYNESFNHIKIFGKKETYNIYKTNIQNFNIFCKEFDIYNNLFEEIIQYLNDNIYKYVHDL